MGEKVSTLVVQEDLLPRTLVELADTLAEG